MNLQGGVTEGRRNTLTRESGLRVMKRNITTLLLIKENENYTTKVECENDATHGK